MKVDFDDSFQILHRNTLITNARNCYSSVLFDNAHAVCCFAVNIWNIVTT